ncbi:MAG: hypothetical protein SGPRY_010346, partial [Prymnesium sp.]
MVQIVVKARVMQALGKLLLTLLHSWARLARRRACCRQAALTCVTRRRERASDRRASFHFKMALRTSPKPTIHLARRAAHRWLRLDETFALEGWREVATSTSHLKRQGGVALSLWTGKLRRWAFSELAMAVRLSLLERAAAYYWASSALGVVVGRWRGEAHRLGGERAKAGHALVHWASRLAALVLYAWLSVTSHWRQLRLGKLASVLHYEGTLAHRVMRAWSTLLATRKWRRGRVMEARGVWAMRTASNVFTSWASHTRHMAVTRLFAGQRGEVANAA